MVATVEKPVEAPPSIGAARFGKLLHEIGLLIHSRGESQHDDRERAKPADSHTDRLSAKGLERFADMEPLMVHDMVTRGLPVLLARTMMDSYELVQKDAVLQAIGVSERTLQRGKDADRRLDSNASDRLLRLAAITEHAIDVLGSQEEAERWLLKPALALDQRRPIDLLQSSEGTELVKALLTRMDYGVYA
jgi:putative toxin-antitoxin system antitoxin component (TIGR02293 family)